MAISATGLGASGLDVTALVSQLMTAESQPVKQLNANEAAAQAKLSAFGALKSALSQLQTAAQGMSSLARFQSYSSSVSDSSLATVSVGEKPAVGRYSLEVLALAQAHKLKSEAFGSTETALGAGTITIDFGKYSGGAFTADADTASLTITVNPGEDSVAAIRDAINAAGGDATASIVNDGTGARLVVGSKETGATHAIRISVDDADGNDGDNAGLSRLAFDASTGGVSQLTEALAARDAEAVIDGIKVVSSTNTISGALEGVTINLTKASPGTVATLGVNRDTAGAKSAVEGFVKAWNDAAKTLTQLSAYDAANKKASILSGDTAIAQVQSRLRNALNNIAPGGGFGSLGEIGLTSQRDGTVLLDSAKLATALSDPTKSIGALFAAAGIASDSNITVASLSKGADPGNLPVEVTQLATRGTATGSQAAALTLTAGVNDSLALKIDGTSVIVTLAAGTYTPAGLAAEIRARVNSDATAKAAGVSLDASESGGVLSLTSRRFGSVSTVEITGGSASADLFGTATSAAGLDVAGTIGGVVATGSGQALSMGGVVLNILGGAVGERGSINVSRGVAARLDDTIAELLGDAGLLESRTDGLDKQVADIGIRRDALNKRLELTEARLKAQYTALDLTLAKMQSTSDWLAGQLASIPKASSNS